MPKKKSTRRDVNLRLDTEQDPSLSEDLNREMKIRGERERTWMIRALLRQALDASSELRAKVRR